jgi:DeoR/GlpR family transcriptional regulator of sugar metabolism
MLVDERRHLIAEAVLARGAATVPELSEEFGVSQVTIRSDLEALDRQGMLTRNRGGAVVNRVARFTPAFQEQSSVHREAKRAIAERAADLLEDGDWAVLDSGSTTLYVVDFLAGRRLTVAVNSVYSMNKLVEIPEIESLLIGGSLYRPALSFAGHLAEQLVEGMQFDKAFLGINGVSDRGVSVNNPAEAGVKRMMMARATQVIALADSSKIGVNSLVRLEPLDAVDVLVTDRGTTDDQVRRLRKVHPQLEVLRV